MWRRNTLPSSGSHAGNASRRAGNWPGELLEILDRFGGRAEAILLSLEAEGILEGRGSPLRKERITRYVGKPVGLQEPIFSLPLRLDQPTAAQMLG